MGLKESSENKQIMPRDLLSQTVDVVFYFNNYIKPPSVTYYAYLSEISQKKQKNTGYEDDQNQLFTQYY